jgi:RHS repeat-associated protein
MTVAGEPVVNYSYDDAGRPAGISRNVGATPRTYRLGYDNGNRRASVQIPLATGADFITTIYGYDIANRLISMLLQGPTAQIENLAYTYDPNGNRLSFARSVAQTLSPAVSSTNHDAANEMLALGGKNFTYDQNGNLQTRTDTCGTTTYSWDARNRLTGINGYKPDCTALTASFGYDALNRRISKTINGATTQFVYDGWDVTQEIKAGVKTNYVRTLNIDEPLTRITGTTIRHYVTDALGSIMALANDTGATKTTYVYDAFGNATATGETSDNPFQYTGRENDETGLYYYRARYFSPEMQRFISEDPIRLGGGINYFLLVHNNPVNRKDPLGLFDNPLLKIPSFSDSFPNSKCVAPIADLIAGGVEAGFAISFGVGSAIGFAAGPETWWIPIIYGGAAIEAGADAIDRISTGIEKLGNQECKSKCR